ncbi:MAG: reverse transcriptase domain-containing protein [Myxococcota bacterium]
MKTYRGRFAQVCDADNLRRACEAAARGKRHQPEVAGFLFHRDWRLRRLQMLLQTQVYRPLPGRLQLIRDPKPRAIVITPFENRVVQHALCDVLEPLLSRHYIHDTYACLKGRGTHRAVLRLKHFMQTHRYVLQLDLKKYFLSIPRERLMQTLERQVPDAPLLALIRRIIEQQPWLYDDASVRLHLGDPAFQSAPGCGLAIGHLTSQVFSNFYLNSLDHFIKRELKIGGYIRYMDDLTVLGNSRAQLHQWTREIRAFVTERLGLRLNEQRIRIHPCTAKVLFLGYRVGREGIGPGKRLLGRLRRLVQRSVWRPLSPHRLLRLKHSLTAYRGLLLPV